MRVFTVEEFHTVIDELGREAALDALEKQAEK